MSAKAESTAARFPGRMARYPSSNGSSDAASALDPTTAGLRKTIISAERPRVKMHRREDFGMLRSGSRTSSAANGSCSMPRNSHIANGIA
ncbi:MAG: hypothetical protein ACFWT0_10470 [Bifidobacterium crudilactis]